jgi:hypothetical protein
MPRPRPIPLDEFLSALDRMKARTERGEPCCTDGSCVICRAAAEEDYFDAEREDRRLARDRGED